MVEEISDGWRNLGWIKITLQNTSGQWISAKIETLRRIVMSYKILSFDATE